MTILILERVTPGVRGEITKWMLEVKAGVFVGRVSAMVRDRLWERACQGVKDGSAVLIYATNNEQGYVIEMIGDRTRVVRDFEGLALISTQ